MSELLRKFWQLYRVSHSEPRFLSLNIQLAQRKGNEASRCSVWSLVSLTIPRLTSALPTPPRNAQDLGPDFFIHFDVDEFREWIRGLTSLGFDDAKRIPHLCGLATFLSIRQKWFAIVFWLCTFPYVSTYSDIPFLVESFVCFIKWSARTNWELPSTTSPQCSNFCLLFTSEVNAE